MRVALSTGGGDAPGLNAVIRAAVITSMRRGWEVFGIERGFGGLLGDGEVLALDRESVRGITHIGGTILGTTNRGNPFSWSVTDEHGAAREVDRSDEVIESFGRLGLDALIVIGGDGTLHIANELSKKGLPLVGVPKTIDNDVRGTLVTFGFETAVATATDAIDKVHSTAQSHERVLVVEVMGRHAGWIALKSGLAGTADIILLPEIPYDIGKVCEKVAEREREGRHFSIVVVAEGARPKQGDLVFKEGAQPGGVARLGGIGERVAAEIEAHSGKETRAVTLGHLQRGGTPVPYDRALALRFGAAAVRGVAAGKFGCMVGLDPPDITYVPLEEALGEPAGVQLDGDTVCTVRELGVCLGD